MFALSSPTGRIHSAGKEKPYFVDDISHRRAAKGRSGGTYSASVAEVDGVRVLDPGFGVHVVDNVAGCSEHTVSECRTSSRRWYELVKLLAETPALHNHS